MTTTATKTTIVTAEQLAACERIEDLQNGHAFYIVRSASDALKEYKVEAIRKNNAWITTCTCPAGLNGRPCWHKRAVAAAVEERKAGLKAAAQAQAKIDAQKPLPPVAVVKERIESRVPQWMLTAPVARHMKQSPRER